MGSSKIVGGVLLLVGVVLAAKGFKAVK